MGTSRVRPVATAGSLVGLGFSASEAARLLALRERFDRGDLNELTQEVQRPRFVRWLVEQRRLHEGKPTNWADADEGGALRQGAHLAAFERDVGANLDGDELAAWEGRPAIVARSVRPTPR